MTAPWTLRELAHLWSLMRAGEGLAFAAEALGRFVADCDYALWVMVGRQPMDALEILRSRPAPAVLAAGPAKGSALGRFIAEVLP